MNKKFSSIMSQLILLALCVLFGSSLAFANYSQLVGGNNWSFALKDNGTIWVWGENNKSQLGDGTTKNRLAPIPLRNSQWKAVSSAGPMAGAIKSDGTLWVWGGVISDHSSCNTCHSNTPKQIGIDSDWKEVSVGRRHVLLLKSDGTLWAFGHNDRGQLGVGTTGGYWTSPTQIGNGNDWAKISAGKEHSAAIKNDGTLWSWGRNDKGQLGIGSTTNTNVPTQVGTAADWDKISARDDFTLAIKSDGTLWAWGKNEKGQLGLGNTTNRNIPTQVGTANDWASVSAGKDHTIALKADGSLWAWGNNEKGQLGRGNTTSSNIPIQIGQETNWVDIAAGNEHNLAVKNDGTLWVWGKNDKGQLGDGTITQRNSPVQQPLPKITVIPEAIDFGNVALNDSKEQEVIIRNDGNNLLYIPILTLQGNDKNDFSILADNCSENSGRDHIDQNYSCLFKARFIPSSSGLKGAEILILSNDPETEDFTLALSGQGYRQVNLSVNKSGTGSGTVTSNPPGIDCGSNCSGIFNNGTVVTLTATADTDSAFEGWTNGTGSASVCTGEGTCSFTLDSDSTVRATFILKQYTISTSTSPVSGGTISCDPNPVNHSSTSICTITTNQGYTLQNIEGTCGGVLTGNTYTTNELTADCSIVVNYSSNKYTLTITKSGAGSGTVISNPTGIDCGGDCSEIYDNGTVVTLIATADSGSTFAGWGGHSNCSDGQVVMDSDKTCIATFNIVNTSNIDLTGKWLHLNYSPKSKQLKGKLKIQNISANASKFKVAYYLSMDGVTPEKLISTKKINKLQAGKSVIDNLSYRSKNNLSGKFVIAIIDIENEVFESDESNNMISIPIP